MATIEERVKDAVHKQYDCVCPCYGIDDCKFGNGDNTAYSCGDCGADEFEQGYIKGATEQRQIDIDKACEWINRCFADAHNEYGFETVYPLQYFSKDKMIAAFREAMTNGD